MQIMQKTKKEAEKIFQLSDVSKKFDIKKQNIFKVNLIIGGNSVRERLFNLGIKEGNIIEILHLRKNGPCIILVNDVKLIIGVGMTKRIFVEPILRN